MKILKKISAMWQHGRDLSEDIHLQINVKPHIKKCLLEIRKKSKSCCRDKVDSLVN